MQEARTLQPEWVEVADTDLLAPIAAGDTHAFAALMRRHNRTLYRAARSITGDDAEAEDVVQEAWVRAYAHLRTFRGEARLSTWLTRIAVNEALARRRRTRVSVPIEDVDEQQIATVIPFPAPPSDQESDVSRGEVRTMLEQAIDRLPPPFRAVFVLQAVEDVSTQEIATQLGITEGTVRTRMHRARALLRKELEKSFTTCLADVFPFDGARCSAMSRRVLAAIAAEPPGRQP